MDFGHPSEAVMPDLKPSLKSTLLTKIAEFIGESGSLEQYRTFSVWRSLSRINQASADGAVQAQKTANFADCRNLTDATAKHLKRCPQLQEVNFAFCENLTDAAAQHLAQCPQIQTMIFQGREVRRKLNRNRAKWLRQMQRQLRICGTTSSAEWGKQAI